MSCLCLCGDGCGHHAKSGAVTEDAAKFEVDAADVSTAEQFSRERELARSTTSRTARSASPSPTPWPTSKTPASSSPTRKSRGPTSLEFEVRIEKGSGGMGLDLAGSRDGRAMLVGRVNAGAVQEWNAACDESGRSDLAVQRGDRLVEVGGCGRGESGVILKTLKDTSGTVTIKVMRLAEFKVTNLVNVPRSHLGLEFGDSFDGGLMLTAVGATANKALQADVELRPGDSILSVNACAGTFAELRAEIEKNDSLTLRVRRPT